MVVTPSSYGAIRFSANPRSSSKQFVLEFLGALTPQEHPTIYELHPRLQQWWAE